MPLSERGCFPTFIDNSLLRKQSQEERSDIQSRYSSLNTDISYELILASSNNNFLIVHVSKLNLLLRTTSEIMLSSSIHECSLIWDKSFAAAVYICSERPKDIICYRKWIPNSTHDLWQIFASEHKCMGIQIIILPTDIHSIPIICDDNVFNLWINLEILFVSKMYWKMLSAIQIHDKIYLLIRLRESRESI